MPIIVSDFCFFLRKQQDVIAGKEKAYPELLRTEAGLKWWAIHSFPQGVSPALSPFVAIMSRLNSPPSKKTKSPDSHGGKEGILGQSCLGPTSKTGSEVCEIPEVFLSPV